MATNNVENVTLTITLGSGDSHTLTIHAPGPQGSNPRFMVQQLEAAIDELHGRANKVLTAYGTQAPAIDAGFRAIARAATQMVDGNRS